MYMKRLKMIALTAVTTMALGFVAAVPELNIGDAMPMTDVPMQDISGDAYTLSKLKQDNGLLVIFSCNTCPFVLQWEDRYNELYDLAKKNNIGMVLINSNEAKRNGDDSLEEMKAKAKEQGYKMHYVVDKDHKVADAFGARTTPHIYLFDEAGKLAYRGLIDDNGKDKNAVEAPYLKNAITAMASGSKIEPETTKAVGCSIKRVGA